MWRTLCRHQSPSAAELLTRVGCAASQSALRTECEQATTASSWDDKSCYASRHCSSASTPPPDPSTAMEFPGGKVPFTNTLEFLGGSTSSANPMPCYRTIDSFGKDVEAATVTHDLNRDAALQIYRSMVMLQAMDTVFYDSQRQVNHLTMPARISSASLWSSFLGLKAWWLERVQLHASFIWTIKFAEKYIDRIVYPARAASLST